MYTYTYLKYVYLGSISSLMQISLNILDILCLHIFFWIRSNSRITFIVFGGGEIDLCIVHSCNKKIKLIIYYNKFKTSNLVIRNNSSPSIGVLQKTNVIYKFKCPLGDCISDNNNIYVGLTSTTLSRRLTMHLSDTSSIAQH